MVNVINDTGKISLGIGLSEELSQSFFKTKNLVNETTTKTVNNLTELTNKSLSSVTEAAEKANHSLSAVAEAAKDSLTQSTTKAVNNISQVSAKAVDSIAETTKHAEDSLLESVEKTKNSLDDALQKAELLSKTVSTEVERAVSSLINHELDNLRSWIDAHPVISWMLKSLIWSINHPIMSIFIILLSIYITWQLFKSFSHLLEQGLLATLTAPFKFFLSLFKLSFKPLTFWQRNFNDSSNSQDSNERLAKLLSRLEAIKQEQNGILQEITTIVSANK